MTRKDYIAIAEALKSTRAPETTGAHYRQWEMDVRAVAQAFKSDNPRFDASRFFQACGLDS